MKRIAVRSARLCTQDRLCRYVCPTGATNTETGVIDTAKCMGCGVCTLACPSGAIAMIPVEYPPQQKKDESVVQAALALSALLACEEKIAGQLAGHAENDGVFRLMTAFAQSLRLVHEDVLSEAGYLLPQCAGVRKLLAAWEAEPPFPGFPSGSARRLLRSIRCNEEDE